MSEPSVSLESDVRERIVLFLKRNFPQIRMHGGQAAITSINLEEKSVTIELGGACDGCGLSPMTIHAVKERLPKDIDEIDHVSVGTDLNKVRAENSTNTSDAPF